MVCDVMGLRTGCAISGNLLESMCLSYSIISTGKKARRPQYSLFSKEGDGTALQTASNRPPKGTR